MNGQRDIHTYKAIIREGGAVQAGGLTLFHLDPSAPALIKRDRYHNRSVARGTDIIRVDLRDLLLLLLEFYGAFTVDADDTMW